VLSFFQFLTKINQCLIIPDGSARNADRQIISSRRLTAFRCRAENSPDGWAHLPILFYHGLFKKTSIEYQQLIFETAVKILTPYRQLLRRVVRLKANRRMPVRIAREQLINNWSVRLFAENLNISN
jgi:hypothetical protein